jgi:hypothetical protein
MDREQIGSVLAGALEDHNDGYEGCTMCGPWFTCDVKLVLNEVPDLLAAIDELEDEHATEVNRLRACWEEMRAEKDAAHVRIAELTEILASSREARIQLGKDLDELEARRNHWNDAGDLVVETRTLFRQVGWRGHRAGDFYPLDSRPQDTEPGGFSPVYIEVGD